jgi:hypothetical protein
MAEYNDPFSEVIDPEDAAREAAYYAALDRAEAVAAEMERLANEIAEEADWDEADPGFDETPDGCRPDGLYVTPRWCSSIGARR